MAIVRKIFAEIFFPRKLAPCWAISINQCDGHSKKSTVGSPLREVEVILIDCCILSRSIQFLSGVQKLKNRYRQQHTRFSSGQMQSDNNIRDIFADFLFQKSLNAKISIQKTEE